MPPTADGPADHVPQVGTPTAAGSPHKLNVLTRTTVARVVVGRRATPDSEGTRSDTRIRDLVMNR